MSRTSAILPSRAPARAHRLACVVYLIGALVLAWPWLRFAYLFAPDEYLHVYNACLIDALATAAPGDWLRLNRFPEPNLVGHLWLYLAGKVVPYAWAEKAFVVAIVAGNGYAFMQPSGAPSERTSLANTAPWWRAGLGLLALGFWLSASWQMGFVNYLLGMVAVLAGLVHTSRTAQPSGWRIGAWALGIYFCHPVALLFFLGTVALRELQRRDLVGPWLRPLAGDWAAWIRDIAVWFGIPLALLVAYVLTHSEVSTYHGASPWRLLGLVYFHNDIALFAEGETLWAQLWVGLTMLGVAVGGSLAVARGGTHLLFTTVGAAVLTGAILLVPDYLVGGGLIHQRLMPFWFVWLLWCSRSYLPVGRAARWLPYAAVVLATGLSAGLTVYRLPVLAKAVAYFDELRDFASEIPEGSAVLPASVSGHGVEEGRPLSPKPVLHHFAGIIGCERNLVVLDNYEAFVGYFPLVWRTESRDPFRVLTRGVEAHPARLPVGARTWVNENVDYVLVMGDLNAAFVDSTSSWLLPTLERAATSANGTFTLAKVR